MPLGSILLSTALLLIVGLFILKPILFPVTTNTSLDALGVSDESPLDRKERLLSEIQTLEHDFETGKIPEPEYLRERTALVQSAAQVLREIEESEK